MSKILIGVFLGVFVGALAYELLNRTRPDIIKKIEIKASEKVDSLLAPNERHRHETA
ncbi:MAG: hypothetical protein M1406_03850 [Nitrospirae bacterium]|mgnify:CR=1 FL=1|nr:hypothetical protein [Nitrospirota bacterium]